jgi:hypothetical protein
MLSQPVERPLIIDISRRLEDNQQDINIFRKANKKEKKKNESDYGKNICGYITKKIIRELCSSSYTSHVLQLCQKHGCDYRKLKEFYLPKI